MTSSSQLQAALEALENAVDAAEAAAAARIAASNAETGAAQDSDLDSALAALQREHEGLKSVTGDVSRRLDGAIQQVEAILTGRA
jgi:hypothetical protein